MSRIANIAKDYYDCLMLLRQDSGSPAVDYLSVAFGIDPNSSEFWKVIGAINKRAEGVRLATESLDIPDETKSRTLQAISETAKAFNLAGLTQPWNGVSGDFFKDEIIDSIAFVASSLSDEFNYMVPEGGELRDFQEEIQDLLGWLREHEFHEHDIIRVALIEGLEKFLFDVRYVHYVGWTAPMSDFKSIIIAYRALMYGNLDADVNNIAKAAAMKVGGIISTAYNRMKFAREAALVSRFALDVYGGAHLYLSSSHGVAGYLSYLK